MAHDTMLWQKACDVGARVGKTENYRVSASQAAVEVVEYLKTDQGIMDAVAEGVEPTKEGFFELVKQTPQYPAKVFSSFRSFERLLQIGKAPDPVAADQAEREKGKAWDQPVKTPVTKTARPGGECNKDAIPTDAQVDTDIRAIYNDIGSLMRPSVEMFLKGLPAYMARLGFEVAPLVFTYRPEGVN
jgi:hypothetical protein